MMVVFSLFSYINFILKNPLKVSLENTENDFILFSKTFIWSKKHYHINYALVHLCIAGPVISYLSYLLPYFCESYVIRLCLKTGNYGQFNIEISRL